MSWHHESTLPERFRQRVQGWDAALRAGLRRIATLVEREAMRNLSGPGGANSPGHYPVPRRTGFLARSMFSRVRGRTAEVGNTAEYAPAIHNGFRAFGNPHAPYYGARPFLADAAQTVDPVRELSDALAQVLP